MMENSRTRSLNAGRISFHATLGYVLMLLCVSGFGQSAVEAQDPAPGTDPLVRTDIVRSIEF